MILKNGGVPREQLGQNIDWRWRRLYNLILLGVLTEREAKGRTALLFSRKFGADRRREQEKDQNHA